jgi:hypothetical protein
MVQYLVRVGDKEIVAISYFLQGLRMIGHTCMYSNMDNEYAGKTYINMVGKRGGHLQRYEISSDISFSLPGRESYPLPDDGIHGVRNLIVRLRQ